MELNREYIDKLKEIIEAGDEQQALQMMESLHAADIADIYDELNIEEAKFLYLLLDGEKAADVLIELTDDDRQKFLKVLPSEVIAKQFIDNMDSDDAADIIGEMEEDRQEEILSHIDDLEQAGDIVDLLNYDEDTAGGLMAKELIAVNEEWSMPTSLKEMRKQAIEVDEVYYIYVVNDANVLTGVLPLKKMLLSPSVSKVRHVMKKDPISVKTDTPSEEVAQIIERYDLVALPVVDSIGRLVGRITVDDVVDVIREEADKDYQMASGISQDVEASDKVIRLTKARIPWLLIGLFGGVCSALVISLFEGNLHLDHRLAFFIPLIAAMGGNVGIQSSAIIVKDIAAGVNIFDRTFLKLFKELSVALINAIILSSLIFSYNFFFNEGIDFALTVSISLFSVIIFASLSGTIVPLTLHKLKIDPALATGPFITTMNDIVGLFIYMTISGQFFG
ncbi:magnesium transporter [Saccharicrinis sp. FJH2]|uniref:magnesium transporter n=1 Tax=unclassified Saccharicrinis TaxID=2646859 RepID=UPI0035D4E568